MIDQKQVFAKLGAWFRKHRQALGLDVRAVAKRARIHSSSYSRIENGGGAQMWTVVSICDALGITFSHFVVELRQNVVPQLYTDHHTRPVLPPEGVGIVEGGQLLTLQDVQVFVDRLRTNVGAMATFVTTLHALPFVDETLATYTFDALQIDSLAAFVVAWRLPYPSAISDTLLVDTHAGGGILLHNDVGAHIRHLRQSLGQSLAALEKGSNLPHDVLHRLETGALEQVKLKDVLILDALLVFDGRIFAMYWHVAKLYKQMQDTQAPLVPDTGPRIWTAQEFALASRFIVLCRWLQILSPTKNDDWIAAVRAGLV